MDTKLEVIKLLSKASGLKESEVLEILEVPPSPEQGDYALPCFKLAAKLKKNPQQIANELKNKISIPKNSGILEIKNIGPYVNFFLDSAKMAESAISKIMKEKEGFGKSGIGKGEQVVIDVIGLNPNKAGHIGHIKTGSVGNSIARIYSFLGFKTNTQSFINDQGFPTALTFYAYKYMKGQLPKRIGSFAKEDHWQGEIYIMMKNLAEKDEELKKKVEKLQFDLEHSKDLKLLKEQREFIEKCKSAQAQTWARFGADFDLGVHESDITNSGILEETFELLKEKGAVFTSNAPESKGCLLLRLSKFDEFKGMLSPDKILVRSDGRATYTGKDVGLQFWRFGLVPDKMLYAISSKTKTHTEWATNNLSGKKVKNDFSKNTKCIHVVGAEQKYVISVDYYALKAAGFEKEFKNSYHVATGLVGFGESAKISSREGTELTADGVLDKAKALALEEVIKRNPLLARKEAEELAEKIGVSAVRYYLLKTEPTKFVSFSFEDALSFDGNTGPYLQYALVRAKKILNKGKPKGKADFGLLKSPEEVMLVKKLSEFPAVVEKAGMQYAPSMVAGYAFELANSFSSFYEKCPVLNAEADLKTARLKLVQAFAQVLKNALYLLGIEEVEVM